MRAVPSVLPLGALAVLLAAPLAAQSSAAPLPVLLGTEVASADTTRPAAPAADTAAPAAKAPAAVVAGVGTVKFTGLVQSHFSAGSETTETFRIRRAELKFAGEVTDRASWTIMVDAAKSLRIAGGAANQGSLLLQDAYVTLGFGAGSLRAGQFKLPLGYEGGELSNGKLDTVERALYVERGKLGSSRDLGVMLEWPLGALELQAGAFNGSGESQNSIDANSAKTLAGRALLPLGASGLSVGASGAWAGREAADNPRRDRAGAEARFARGPMTLRGEWMRGWEGDFERDGWFAHAGYAIGRAEVVARYDRWDADLGLTGDLETDRLLGLNYHLLGHNAKAQVNYVRRSAPGGADRDLVLLNVQTAW